MKIRENVSIRFRKITISVPPKKTLFLHCHSQTALAAHHSSYSYIAQNCMVIHKLQLLLPTPVLTLHSRCPCMAQNYMVIHEQLPPTHPCSYIEQMLPPHCS